MKLNQLRIRSIRNSQRGFTLVEMLVVMSIMVIITTTSIVQFRAGEKQRRTHLAADTINNAIRTAQSLSLSGKKTANADPNCRIPRYYYLHIDYTGTYRIFADNNCGGTDTVETYTLPPRTRIQPTGLKVNNISATNYITIAFYPPFGTLRGSRDGGALASFTSETITVQPSDGSFSRTVTIDGVSGRIGE